MSLISLLIALAAERYLSSSVWQFNYYYQGYLNLFNRFNTAQSVANESDKDSAGIDKNSPLANAAFIALPVIACYLFLGLLGDGFFYLIASTLVLIVCFGCVKTRNCYKQYLLAAFRGESTTCELHHLQLLQDKNLAGMGFGQSLVWLNYRYFIAIMVFFVLFGAPGALAYRLLVKLNEGNRVPFEQALGTECEEAHSAANESVENEDVKDAECSNEQPAENINALSQQLLFWFDWLPVRFVSLGYMLVGHFSKAMPTWLENFFDLEKSPHTLLIDVAQKSEDFMIDENDCTAEPCLLVRLAKRTLLLCLVVISVLILTGVLS